MHLADNVVENYLKATGKTLDQIDEVDKTIINIAKGMVDDADEVKKISKISSSFDNVSKVGLKGLEVLGRLADFLEIGLVVYDVMAAYTSGDTKKAAAILLGKGAQLSIETIGGSMITGAISGYIVGFGAAIGGPVGAAVGGVVAAIIGYGTAGTVGNAIYSWIMDLFGVAESARPVDPIVLDLSGNGFSPSIQIESHIAEKKDASKKLYDAQKELKKAQENGDEVLIDSLSLRVDSYKEAIESKKREYKEELNQQIFALKQEAETYSTQYKKYQIENEKYVIESPVDGYVNFVSATHEGQVVTNGSTIATIVPTDSNLEFECYIQDKDRAEIEVGMDTNLKLSAYSFSDYGAITGKVTKISPSVFNHELYGNVYVVNISINNDEINPDIKLISGLSGNVEIITGKQTVLHYFLKPVSKALRESLKEN